MKFFTEMMSFIFSVVIVVSNEGNRVKKVTLTCTSGYACERWHLLANMQFDNALVKSNFRHNSSLSKLGNLMQPL